MTIGLNRFIDFLPFDFGKLWSFFGVSKPTRPLTAHERAQRFHYVTSGPLSFVHPDDLTGHVYITPENKAVYWGGEQSDAQATEAHYLIKTSEEVLAGKQKGYLLFDNIGKTGDGISADDRRQLLCDYYGDQKGLALSAITLG